MSSSNYLIKNKIVVRQSIYQFLLGITNTLFWGFGLIYGVIFPDAPDITTLTYLGLGLFLLMGLWFIWLFIIWKVVLEDDIIHFTNCFSKKSTIRLEDIEKVKFRIPRNPKHESEATLITKSGKEFLTTPGSARGAGAFIKYLGRANIKFE